jgi:hypothetical protein
MQQHIVVAISAWRFGERKWFAPRRATGQQHSQQASSPCPVGSLRAPAGFMRAANSARRAFSRRASRIFPGAKVMTTSRAALSLRDADQKRSRESGFRCHDGYLFEGRCPCRITGIEASWFPGLRMTALLCCSRVGLIKRTERACSLATKRLASLYRWTMNHDHSLANQRSFSSFGLTITNSRSTTNKLVAYATVIKTVPVIQCPLPTTNTAMSFRGSTRHTGTAKSARDLYGPSPSIERLTICNACLIEFLHRTPVHVHALQL